MKKIACYCLTRNLYPLIWPSLNSMLERGNVDKVCILAEDDEIAPAVQLPEQVEVLNVSGQKFFSAAGPNYLNKWTYMAMMKTVMSEIFPTMSRVLTIDHDTVILGDISELWEIPLNSFYLAGAMEPYWTRVYGRDYINTGVLMWNIDKMIQDDMTDRLIYKLNTQHYPLHEQECINETLKGGKYVFDSAFNFCDYVEPPKREIKIIHLAGRTWKESFMYHEIWGKRG